MKSRMKVFIKGRTPIKQSLDALLATPRPISVKRLHVGEVRVERCGMERTKLRTHELLPVYVYLVHHLQYGYYLIDAGLDSSFITKPYGSQRGLLRHRYGCKAYQRPEQSITYYLEQQHMTLNGIFLSHLHFDHIAGLIDLKAETVCTLGIDERSRFIFPFYYGRYLKRIKTVEKLNFDGCTRLEPLNEALDYFGDQSLIIVSTPGHSSGHISFLINGEAPCFIAGDAYGYQRDTLIKNGPGTYSSSFKMSAKTLYGIIEFASTYPSVRIYTGHGA